MTIKRLNPETLHKNPAYSQVIAVTNPKTLVYVGGQNGVTTDGEVVSDKLAAQTVQTLKNVTAALAAAGATFEDVLKLTVYVVQGHPIQEAFAAFQEAQPKGGKAPPPPAISIIIVAGLANPRFLIEIEAVAALG